MKRKGKALLFGILAICAGGAAYKRSIRMPWKEYARYALRMAELDDAIERSELDGSTIEGKTIVFPPKSESVQQRYHLFLSVNRRKSRNVLRGEIARMEQRLRESGRYAEQPKKELSADWAEQNERADKT